MKLGVLTSIAHNLADSIACGNGFMIGVYGMDVFGEAAATPEGYIEVDLLTGATIGGVPSPSLANGLKLYSSEALPRLCSSHGASVSDFRVLTVRFWRPPASNRFKISVEDQKGRRADAEYEGLSSRRVRNADAQGAPSSPRLCP